LEDFDTNIPLHFSNKGTLITELEEKFTLYLVRVNDEILVFEYLTELTDYLNFELLKNPKCHWVKPWIMDVEKKEIEYVAVLLSYYRMPLAVSLIYDKTDFKMNIEGFFNENYEFDDWINCTFEICKILRKC
jgi:hypothetical protein